MFDLCLVTPIIFLPIMHIITWWLVITHNFNQFNDVNSVIGDAKYINWILMIIFNNFSFFFFFAFIISMCLERHWFVHWNVCTLFNVVSLISLVRNVHIIIVKNLTRKVRLHNFSIFPTQVIHYPRSLWSWNSCVWTYKNIEWTVNKS